MTGKVKTSESNDKDEGDASKNDSDDDSAAKYLKQTNQSIKKLMKQQLPENRQTLIDSQINLEKIAVYCDCNYLQANTGNNNDGDGADAFKMTKNYTQQALASIASQIYSYASNIQTALNLLEQQFDTMDAQTRLIGNKLFLHQEKYSRREIGRLTKPKHLVIQAPIIYPDQSKLDRMLLADNNKCSFNDSIDFDSLDKVGCAYRIHQQNDKSQPIDSRIAQPIKSATLRPSKSSNLSSIIASTSAQSNQSSSSMTDNQSLNVNSINSRSNILSPTMGASMYHSLARNTSKDQQRIGHNHHLVHNHPTPLVIPPPKVPSNYAANKQSNCNEKSSLNDPSQATGTLAPAKNQSNETIAKQADTNINDGDWVPVNYLEKVIAIYDYTADKDDELSFQENSLIYVIRKNEDGWWEGILNGITGLFPGNYVEPCL